MLSINSQISRIEYFNVNGQFQILNLDKDMQVNILITLYKNFELTKRDMHYFVRNNKNLGVILYLMKGESDYCDSWKQFIDLFFPRKKHMAKSDNVIVSKDYSKLLLITERKILLDDLKNLNNVIFRINKLIKEYNKENILILEN